MALKETNFEFQLPHFERLYRGKVRDVYIFDEKLAIVATNRISAFDIILPKAIPFKGQILNKIAAKSLEQSKDIAPNWIESVPHPNIAIGKKCDPFPVEMVIRGYLAGHAWRTYKSGTRTLCGVPLPEGLKENDKLPNPIITPTTKAQQGQHDEDISKEEILKQGLVSQSEYEQLEKYTYALFERGTQLAAQQGLILVDTKYEFGTYNGEIHVIDEIHTPDSSRYFYKEGYQERQERGEKQKQLSKEFVRQWLIEHNFQGKEGDIMPELPETFVLHVSNRYKELYQQIIGESIQLETEEHNLELMQSIIASNV